MQSKTPAWLRANLPQDPQLRRKTYLSRYRRYWQSTHPDYMKTYQRRYHAAFGSQKKNRMK